MRLFKAMRQSATGNWGGCNTSKGISCPGGLWWSTCHIVLICMSLLKSLFGHITCNEFLGELGEVLVWSRLSAKISTGSWSSCCLWSGISSPTCCGVWARTWSFNSWGSEAKHSPASFPESGILLVLELGAKRFSCLTCLRVECWPIIWSKHIKTLESEGGTLKAKPHTTLSMDLLCEDLWQRQRSLRKTYRNIWKCTIAAPFSSSELKHRSW